MKSDFFKKLKFKNARYSIRYTILVLSALLIVFFQNCGTGFQALKPNQGLLGSSGETGSVDAVPECRFNGAVVPNGSSVTGFEQSTVPGGQVCLSETRTCSNGSLSGSFNFSSCSVGVRAACLFNGLTVQSGQSITGYQSSTVPFGQTCAMEARLCNDGNLTGSFSFASCSVGAAAACLFGGQMIASGQSTVAYQTAMVPFGQTCAMERRSCSNGTLSGSYGFSACAVAARPPVRKISAGYAHGCALVGDKVKCWGRSLWSKFANALVDFGTPAQPLEVLRSGITDMATKSFSWECHINTAGALTCTGGTYERNSGGFSNGAVDTRNLVSSGATQVAVAHFHACAVVGGRLLCWQLSDGRTPVPPAFEIAIGDPLISDLAVSDGRNCAVVSGGAVKCWTHNLQFSAVTGTYITSVTAPVTVIAAGATKISMSQEGAGCAIVQSNLLCWGPNYARTDGSVVSSPTPELVQSGVADVSLAQNGNIYETCVVRLDGAVQCWGGERPTPVRTLIPSGASTVHILTNSALFTAVGMRDGTVMTSGLNGVFTRVNLD